MPIPARTGRPGAGGAYRAVRDRIEAHARDHEARVAGQEGGPSAHPYTMQRILHALRAGQRIDVPLWAVPAPALVGVAAPVDAGIRRAIVAPDDSVEIIVDTAGWLEDEGLAGGSGMPPEQYDLYPTSTKYRGPR